MISRSFHIRVLLCLSALLLLSACVKQIGLFEEASPRDAIPHIGNFYALNIFDDYITDELWYSEEADCINVKGQSTSVYSGTGALHVTWDKNAAACDWVGMGIGWDNWAGKNLGQVYGRTAIDMKVRTDGRPMKSIPGAIGLEDHSGAQAWVGFSRNMIQGEEIGQEWTHLTIPILAFNWAEQQADVSNIKQLIIQFEASGDMYLDAIEVVESEASLRKKAEVVQLPEGIASDLLPTRFDEGLHSLTIERDTVLVAYDADALYLIAKVMDDTPLENVRSGEDIWNGDAFEIAFATDPNADVSRKLFLSTDRHIGIRLDGGDAYVWDWKKDEVLKGCEVKTVKQSNGYRMEARIPFTSLGALPFQKNTLYGLEIALDKGTEQGRLVQHRWNEPDADGFYNDPSLWGEMKITDRWRP